MSLKQLHSFFTLLNVTGPHKYEEAVVIRDAIKALFPGADVVASDSFDDFVTAVLPFKDSLPVVTQEIGVRRLWSKYFAIYDRVSFL